MTDVRELFPEAKDKYYEGSFDGPDYVDYVKAMGYEIVESDTFGSYEGDALYLLRNGDEWGWLVHGYGSCSGCDSAQACDSYEEVQQLFDDLKSSIHWEPSRAALALYLAERYTVDEGDPDKFYPYELYEEGVKEFVARIIFDLANREVA